MLGEAANGAGLGAASDLAQATRLALEMDLNWSFGSADLVWRDARQVDFDRLPLSTQRRIEAQLQHADMAVSNLLANNLHGLNRIATELICRRELTQSDLNELSKGMLPSPSFEGPPSEGECLGHRA